MHNQRVGGPRLIVYTDIPFQFPPPALADDQLLSLCVDMTAEWTHRTWEDCTPAT